MRITNSMITNNSLLYLNRNMQNTMKLQQQYSTGKKINRPSDDPVVLSRSLKMRTSITEGDQYKRNVEDANSWMNVTEQSFVNTMDMLKRMRDLSVQASNDTNTHEERDKILNEISQLREQMAQEGNVSYAGRYVLSGYKTNEPLMFTENTKKEVDIEQSFKSSDITKKDILIDGNPPEKKEVYRIRLGYNNINKMQAIDIKGVTLTTNDKINSTDVGSYEPQEGTINYLKDTGEIIINEADVKKMEGTQGFELTTSYAKDSFKRGEPNPVHYFKNYPYNHINDMKIDGKNQIKLQNTPIKEGSISDVTINNSAVTKIKYTTSQEELYTLDNDEIRVDKDTGILTFGSDFDKKDSVKMTYQHILDNIDTDYQTGIDTDKKVPNTTTPSINLGERNIKADSLNIEFKVPIPPTPDIIYKKDIDPDIVLSSNQIRVNTDTGELIFGSAFKDADIESINYEYERKDKNPQKIEYEVSTNQKITVNELGRDVLTNKMIRDIDELINNVTTTVATIEELDEKLKNLSEKPNLSDEEKEEQTELKQKKALNDDMVGKYFSEMIGKSDENLKTVSKAQAKIGTKINRLNLTTNRLDDDKINYTDLLSKTEDVNMAEVIVNIKSQEMIYNASLMATAKVIQQTLLDFIR